MAGDSPSEERTDNLEDAMASWELMARQQEAAMEQLAPLVTKKEDMERVLAPLLVNKEQADRAVNEIRRRLGVPDEDAIREVWRLQGIRSDPMGDLAKRIADRSQQQAHDAIRQRTLLAETAQELSEEKAAAEQEHDTAELDRIAREQRSVELAELTFNSTEAIRYDVSDAIVAGSKSQRHMQNLNWSLIVIGAITMLASIGAAVAAIIAASHTP